MTPGRPRVDRAWLPRLKLNMMHRFSDFAFSYNLCRYSKVGGAAAGGKEAGGAGGAPTTDLSVECAGMLVALHLAQAQECFFDTASTTGKSPAAGAYTRSLFSSTYALYMG